jgi:hypothetical protein
MSTIVSDDDVKQFQGGWSYTSKEMGDFFKFVKSKEEYKILEFGSGNSTKIMYDIMERFCKNIEYDTYETDAAYKVVHKNVNSILYTMDEIDNVQLLDKKYDIILIDGPNGVNRYKWYEKIRNNVSYDTIILIDDYNHYKEFEDALNAIFKYRVLSASDEPFVPYGEHSWRIITDIEIK